MPKSPLFHILLFGFLLGVVLLVVFGRPSSVDDERRVVVSPGDVQQLRASWVKMWQREPTDVELRAQVEQLVRDEVLYREAVRLGYDKGDKLVRHTMKLKMEFLGEAQADQIEPSDEEMQAYYSMRQERYRVPGEVSFVHVYFNRDKRGEQTTADAEAALAELISKKTDPHKVSGIGDRFMLKNHYVGQDETEIRAAFGDEFAGSVIGLEAGSWQGPVKSAYGVHLVHVYDRAEPYLPGLADIKEKISGDMEYEARQAAKDLFYTEILRNYQIDYDEENLTAAAATQDETP